MHDWSDYSFDWESLSKAEYTIYNTLKIFRIGCDSKEKWGYLRVSVSLFDGTIHSILYPGYASYQYSNWKICKFLKSKLNIDLANLLLKLDIFVLHYPKFWLYRKFIDLIRMFQLNVGYRLAYYVAMKKFPHIVDEICKDADYPEYIIGGKEIHDKYWTTVGDNK